jgi:hypothetical protein
MRESLKCVPISKRDYDVANALHIKAYECTVEEDGVDYGLINYCPDCGKRVKE